MYHPKTPKRLPTSILVAASLAALMIPALSAMADVIPGSTSTDVFDSSAGTTILAHDTLADPINVFRTSGGQDDGGHNGHAFMRNGGIGSVSYIEFQTGCTATVDSLRFFAAHDPQSIGFRRAISRVKLYADADGDGSFETLVVDRTLARPYRDTPGNVAAHADHLDLTISLSAPTTAERWRFETTQATNRQPYDGPRVVELDASGTCAASLDVKPNGCPNPVNLLSNGVLPVAIVGTSSFDVDDVDVGTVRLEGVAPKEGSAQFADVIEPYAGGFSSPPLENECVGDLEEPDDGITDLTLKFPMKDIRSALCPGVLNGDVILVSLTGNTVNGTPFLAQDVVRIQGACVL